MKMFYRNTLMLLGTASNPIPPSPDQPYGGFPVKYRGPLPSAEVQAFIKRLGETTNEEREGRLQSYHPAE